MTTRKERNKHVTFAEKILAKAEHTRRVQATKNKKKKICPTCLGDGYIVHGTTIAGFSKTLCPDCKK